MALPLGFLNDIGWPELLIILFIALLIFGSRLPGVAKALGRSVRDFKREMNDMSDKIQDESAPEPPKTEETKPAAGSGNKPPQG